MSFNLFEVPSVGGEWDLLGVTFLLILESPFRCGCPCPGLWAVVTLGITLRPTTVGMVHTDGEDAAFAVGSTSEKDKNNFSNQIFM